MHHDMISPCFKNRKKYTDLFICNSKTIFYNCNKEIRDFLVCVFPLGVFKNFFKKMIVKKNLEKILKEVENYNPKIIAVTKYYGIDRMIEAFDAGLRNFGENKALDALEKINKIDDTVKSKSIYHFIGHLQTNKVKHVVGNFEYIHSVDSLKVARCIDQEANKKGIIQKILIQVNNAYEPQKFGIAPDKLENLIKEVKELKSVKLEGLMNIAPLTENQKELRRLFSNLRELKERFNLKELSMGMSHDYKIAVEEGATIIRLGKILFENN